MSETTYSFCQHCGGTISQEQVNEKIMICIWCGKPIGTPKAPEPKKMIDATEDLLRRGVAARCSLCRQVVELKNSGGKKSFVPHYGKGEKKKICPNSGKPINRITD